MKIGSLHEFTGSSWRVRPGEAPPSAEAVDVGPGADWTGPDRT